MINKEQPRNNLGFNFSTNLQFTFETWKQTDLKNNNKKQMNKEKKTQQFTGHWAVRLSYLGCLMSNL